MIKFSEFYKNNFRPFLFINSILLSSLMIIAAKWQWSRYHEKLELVKTYQNNSSSDSIKIDAQSFKDQSINEFRNKKIKILGNYEFEKQVIISNIRTKAGSGSWLLTPVKIENSDDYIMVSRGFIPYEDRSPDSWKKYNLPNNNIKPVIGVLTESKGKRSLLSPSAKTSNPSVFLYPDIGLISEEIKLNIIKDYFIHAIEDPVFENFPMTDIKIDVPPSTHFWYTFEWIGLAITTQIICFLIQLFRTKKIFSNNLHSNIIFIFIISFIFYPTKSFSTPDAKSVPQKAGIIERLGEQIDLNTSFENDDGQIIKLSDFFDGKKPVIIAPVYYECPRLCSLTQEGLLKSINQSDLIISKDYRVLSISFNDKETSKQSSKRAKAYRDQFSDNLKNMTYGWSFLTGNKTSTEALMTQVGFKYEYDQGEFMHAAGIIFVTPNGKISRYLYGVEYSQKDFKLALVEAAEGKIGSFMNQALMYCFRYDHIKGQYTLAIWKIIRIVCSIFVVIILSFVILLKVKEKN